MKIRVSLVTYGIGAKEVRSLSPDYFIDDMRELLPIVAPPEVKLKLRR